MILGKGVRLLAMPHRLQPPPDLLRRRQPVPQTHRARPGAGAGAGLSAHRKSVTMLQTVQHRVLWGLRLLERYRFIKFGIVGASGVVVNLVVLHLGHEYLFASVESGYNKPISPWCWPSAWPRSTTSPGTGCGPGPTACATWKPTKTRQARLAPDRHRVRPIRHRVGIWQHDPVCADLLLSSSMDYRLANIIAIATASVSNLWPTTAGPSGDTRMLMPALRRPTPQAPTGPGWCWSCWWPR